MFEDLRELTAEAQAKGLAVVVWSSPRGSGISQDGATAGYRGQIGKRSSWAHAVAHNIVFAEDEDNLPPDWPTHGMERHGFARGQNSISLAFSNSATNIRRRGAKKETPEEDTIQGMYRMADFMRTPNLTNLLGYQHGTPGVLLIPGVVANTRARLGWTKPKRREFFVVHSRIPMKDLVRAGGPAWVEQDPDPKTQASLKHDPWPLTAKAENFMFM